ncbi:DUF4007 family protein [Metabacillus sp. SLBN-84]
MSYSMNFHQTFSPEREAIAQLVQLTKLCSVYLSKEEISQKTTIPTGERSGKVVPHINYAEIMGLLDFEIKGGAYRLTPTLLGELIKTEDPYLGEPITMWACHYNLASKDSKAKLWSFIFNEVVQQLGSSFLKEVLPIIVNKKFEIDVNLTPFRSCYLNSRSFSTLGLINEEGNYYSFVPHKIEPSFKYLYGYQLLNSWEKHLSDRTEITIYDIKDKLFFGNPYLWSDQEILNVLDLLQDEKIIVLNRQLNPLSAVRQANSKDLISQIYSLLI